MAFQEEILECLRASMKEKNIDAYIIPSTDPHLGEYVPDHWRIIEWLTGFSGSAASVVVTDSFAGLWTDSRYFLQAERQLCDTAFVVMRPVLPERKDYLNWLAENLKAGSRIAVDGKIFSIARLRKMNIIREKVDFSIDTKCDLISDLWTDRPLPSVIPAFDHPVLYCGKDRTVKISEVRALMKKINVNYHLLTSIDDIMWLLNIRGNDIKFSPLMTSFALVGEDQILLFTEESKIPFSLAREFDYLGIVMLPYEETEGMLSALTEKKTILITPATTSAALYYSIPTGMKIIEDISIPSRLKTVKNNVEIDKIGNAMIKDGVVLTKFFFWLEKSCGSIPISEISVEEKLVNLRAEQEFYLGPSFHPIIAYNEHGALPHYSATQETNFTIKPEGILLVDSGSQYLDGTTDITRTIALGKPTRQQKIDFTLVLKGTINLSTAIFPEGTTGSQLDPLARKALWENGLNYGHGTGHGVGFCLNVHEGPIAISPLGGAGSGTFIEPGNLLSNEPAVYREGEYGIRTENLMICYEDEDTEFGRFLRFDTVSLCYIDKTLIDISLLDKKEINWLNNYHIEVYEKLSPYLTEDEMIWLEEKTSVI